MANAGIPPYGAHYIGTNAGGPVVTYITFVNWQWNFDDIPREAGLQSVRIQFNAQSQTYNTRNLTFSIHSIESNWNGIDLSSYYYQVNNNNNRRVYTSPTFTSNSGGGYAYSETFTTGQLFNKFAEAITNGNYYITLAIRSEDGNHPWWELKPPNAMGNTAIDLTITYTTQNQYFTFTNKIGTREDYGHLIADNDILHPIQSGTPQFFPWNTFHSIRTNELPFIINWEVQGNTRKHNRWQLSDTEIYYKLFDTLTSLPSVSQMRKATFEATTPVTIQSLIETTTLGGIFYFRDPWFYYQDQSNNWQRSIEYKTYSSTLNIYNNSLATYGGIFLNQTPDPTDSNASYYIRAPLTQIVNLGGSIGSRTFYPYKWSSSPSNGVEFSNIFSSGTAVIFKSANALVTSNLKGTALSNNSSAYSSGSQRKFVRTDDGMLHSVYESMGRVWYETSTNNGSIWKLDNGGKPLDSGEGKNPSIDYSSTSSPTTYLIYIVYQEKNGT